MKKSKQKIEKGVKRFIPKKTLVNFILDESGSMDCCRDATISGFNEYLKTLNKIKGNVSFSLTKFNSTKVDTVYVNKSIKDIVDLSRDTYIPDACTPLYDAIGSMVTKVGNDAKNKKVLTIIMTDGQENSSKEYTREKIVNLIKEKESEGNWSFVYLGANQDAWLVGQSIGITSQANTFTYDPTKINAVMTNISKGTLAYATSLDMTTDNFCKDFDEPKVKTYKAG